MSNDQSSRHHRSPLAHLGWREWVALPELGVKLLKCKVDTGARTSALHTFRIDRFRQRNKDWVHFGLHPKSKHADVIVECTAEIVDERLVTDSGGHREQRIVIQTPVVIGSNCWPIELTLTDRDTMRFRMLLGRTAINQRFTVDPAASYLAGRPRMASTLKGSL